MEKDKGLAVFWLLMGRMSLLMGCLLLIPWAVAIVWQTPEAWLYIGPATTALIFGLGVEKLNRDASRPLTTREAALFMVCVWLLMGALGAMPYLISGIATDLLTAFFEAIAAITTTGISNLWFDRVELPPTLLLWHSLMSWLGGLCFVIMLATVMPQVGGCFGFTLSARQSVSFSPVWNRMVQSMRQGMFIYSGLTILAISLLIIAGLDIFPAIIRAMLLISSSGGLILRTFLFDNSGSIELVSAIIMCMSGVSLLLTWKAWQRRSIKLLWQDTELRAYFKAIAVAGVLLAAHLYMTGCYDLGDSLRYGVFQAISFISTNGFSTAPFWLWPDFDRYVLFLLVFMGGCLGSVTGGLKIMRLLVLGRMAWAELRRTLHPHMVIAVKIDGLTVPAKILGRILTLLFLYLAVFIIFSVLLSLSGISLLQAMGIAIGCLTSTGSTAALFGVGSLAFFPAWVKLLCCFLMILGRIEIFSFLVLVDIGCKALHKRW